MKFLPTLTGAASGSLGGVTASHNRGGQYLRNRSIPVNTTSTARTDIRNAFATASSQWATLTPTQRAGWADYAANVSVVDTLGQSRKLSGLQWFIAVNTLPYFGQTMITTAPGIFTRAEPISSINSATYGLPTDLLELSANSAETPNGALGLLYLSRPVNPSVNFFKGPFRFVSQAAFASGVVDFSAVASPFTLSVGQKIFYRIVVRLADGRYSTDYIGSLLVTADAP